MKRFAVQILMLLVLASGFVFSPFACIRSDTSKEKEETVAEIQKKVDATLAQLKSLRFDAELTRRVADKEVTRYSATVKMVAGGIETNIYHLGPSPLFNKDLVAKVINGETIFYDDEERVDACLFGTLEQSWFGSPENSSSPFRDWLALGTLIEKTDLAGQTCHQINYERELLFGFSEQKIRRVESFWIDTTNYLVQRWDSIEYDWLGDHYNDEPSMWTSRRYLAIVAEPQETHSH